MNFLEKFRRNKNLELKNEEIKTILQNSRRSLGEVHNKIFDSKTQKEISEICEDFYEANESISSNDQAEIEEPTKRTLIAATTKIEEITKKGEVFDQKSRTVVTTIAAKTLKIRECFLSQKASA